MTELEQLLLIYAHAENTAFRIARVGLEHDIALELKKDKPISEPRTLGQNVKSKESALRVELDLSREYEEDLVCGFAVVKDGLASRVNTSVHVDDELVLKAFVGHSKEEIKVFLEVHEDGIYKFVLKKWRQLLIEIEVLDERVEVVYVSIVHVLLHLHVHMIGQHMLLVRALDVAHPQLKPVDLLINYVIYSAAFL